jgi:hypothetical protein
VRFQLTARTGHPDFLDLPWDLPLADWESERIVQVARGIHRHVVRFVSYEDRIYALKELPERLALREYRLLRALGTEAIPVVDAVGTVTNRRTAEGDPLEAILVTRHLDFSLPFRSLFTRGIPDARTQLIDAIAGLLLRLHIVGFFWGDCSLSNTLFRRDAGALAAYLVDAETGEMHRELTAGQRHHDLEVARENIAGELLDLEVALGGEDLRPIETADELCDRYEQLWSELVTEEVFATDERWKVDERLRRVNELGFDVEEVELVSTDDGFALRLHTHVVEPGHHRRRLLSLTGMDVQENQARRLLNDMAQFRAYLEDEEGRHLPEAVVAYRWLSDVFEPSVAAVPQGLRGKREPAELFHEILEHRYYRSRDLDRDVALDEAVEMYIEEVLRHQPDELTLLGDETLL